jgi:hypothetical protein
MDGEPSAGWGLAMKEEMADKNIDWTFLLTSFQG